MTTQNIGLFKALGAKMDYLNQRQSIISQNVANADTPGFRPMDLKEVDFGTVLKGVTKSQGVGIQMVSTNAMHVGGGNEVAAAKEGKQKKVYEVAPDGNAVIMEEQMLKSGQTVMDYNLMTSLYQKNVSMIKTALGTR
jgi:flagellar basal-body rod protein FlgB